jgi:hypothetical protein
MAHAAIDLTGQSDADEPPPQLRQQELIWQWDGQGRLQVHTVQTHRHLLSAKHHVFHASFRIDDGRIHLVRSRAHRDAPKTPEVSWRAPTLHYSLTLLKSAVQKAVRSGLYLRTKALTQQLLFQDRTATLRRLPIVAPEDVCYRAWWPHLVWLMAAQSKHFDVPAGELQGVVHLMGALAVMNHPQLAVARAPATDATEEAEPEVCRRHWHAASDAVGASRVRLANVHLAAATRIAYGGMGGDGRLVDRELWHVTQVLVGARSDSEPPLLSMDEEGRPFADYVTAAIASTDDRLPAWMLDLAWPSPVDFHCSAIDADVRRALICVCPDEARGCRCACAASKDAARTAVWFLRSSRNFRRLDAVPAGHQDAGTGEPASLDEAPALLLPLPEVYTPPDWWPQYEAFMAHHWKKYWTPTSARPAAATLSAMCSSKRARQPTLLDRLGK